MTDFFDKCYVCKCQLREHTPEMLTDCMMKLQDHLSGMVVLLKKRLELFTVMAEEEKKYEKTR